MLFLPQTTVHHLWSSLLCITSFISLFSRSLSLSLFLSFHREAFKAKTTILVHHRWPPPLQTESNLGFSAIDFDFEKEIEICYGFGLWWVCYEISLYFWVLTLWVWLVIGGFSGASGFGRWLVDSVVWVGLAGGVGGANGFGGWRVRLWWCQ